MNYFQIDNQGKKYLELGCELFFFFKSYSLVKVKIKSVKIKVS